MKPNTKKKIMHTIAALIIALPISFSASAQVIVVRDDAPTGFAMIADAIVARPLMLASTVLGSALFVVTMPFSLLGGNVIETAKTLVVLPAKSTFVRCLGCTPIQNEYVVLERRTAQADKASRANN